MELQAIKSELFTILKNIKSGYNKNQPWLDAVVPFSRPNTYAAQHGKRANNDGSVRTLKLSDVGTVSKCEKIFASSMLGESLMKFDINKQAGPFMNGTMFHSEVEKFMPNSFITPKRDRNQTFVRLPSIGKYTSKDYTGKWFDGIAGQFDTFAPKWFSGLEFKSIEPGRELPVELPKKALIQGALYAHGLKLKGYRVNHWIWLYFPADLSTFNPLDISTYRVFVVDADVLEKVALDALGNAARICAIIESHDGSFSASESQLNCFDEECHYCHQV